MTLRNKSPAPPYALALALLFGPAGCGKDSASAVLSEPVVLSGRLYEYSGNPGYEKYSVGCVTLAGSFTSGLSACDSEGNFRMELSAATGVPISCYVLEGSARVASFSFISAVYGFNGEPQREGAYSVGAGAGGVNFGSVTLERSTASATVLKSQIVPTNTPDSLTGNWEAAQGDWQYLRVRHPAHTDAEWLAQQAQPDGSGTLHIREYEATDAQDVLHYALSLWSNESAFRGCGSAEALTVPTGWNTSSDELKAPFLYLPINPPAATKVPNLFQTCGSAASYCTDVTNVSDPSDAANSVCRALCRMKGISAATTVSSCNSDWRVDWNNGSAPTEAELDSCMAGTNAYRCAGGKVLRENFPSARTLALELVRNANISSGEQRERLDPYPTLSCTLQRIRRATLAQLTSDEAYLEIHQMGILTGASVASCLGDAWILRNLEESKKLLKLTRMRR